MNGAAFGSGAATGVAVGPVAKAAAALGAGGAMSNKLPAPGHGDAAPLAADFRQFICRACGLVYDEAAGDADSGLPPGTRFEDIPDDWSCPLCGVSKADFEPHEARPLDRSTATPTAPTPSRRRGRRDDSGVVIVGAGRAGWQVAQALRARDAGLPITLVSACSADVYDKPTLSVVHARGLDVDALVREPAADAARRLGVRLLPATHAVHIDAAARRLRTTRGTQRYERLVLASGAAARLPAALPASRVWRVNHLLDYVRLRRSLDAPGAPRRVLIVGAGLVGCELANDLALGGHPVTLIDLQPLPLAALLPPRASQRLLQAWQALPLRFFGELKVLRVEPRDDGSTRVTTDDGSSFDADAVIAATGLATPHRLARSAGLAFDARAGGIEVDAATLRTSDPAIHALGDCISIDGRASRYIEPIGRQALAIAAAICRREGESAPVGEPPGPPTLRVKTTAFPITVEGTPLAGGRWEIDSDGIDELRMTQWNGPLASARLVGRRPASGPRGHAAAPGPPESGPGDHSATY